MADLFRLRAFQGLLLLLLGTITLQVGSAAHDGQGVYDTAVQGAVFRADTPEAVLLPHRVEAAALDAPDTGPNLTDDRARAGVVFALLAAGLRFAQIVYRPVPASGEAGHRRLSLPRAPPLF